MTTLRQARRPARRMTRYEPAIDLDAHRGDRRARAHRGRRPRAHARCRADLVEAASALLQRRRPAPRPRQRRRLLPRAPDGGGRLHRRRQHALGHAAALERRDRRGRGAQQRRADPVRLGRPAARRGGGRSARASRRGERSARLQVPPDRAGLRPQRRGSLPAVRGDRRCSACRRSSTPARPESAPGCPGGHGFRLGLSNPMLLDPSPRTSPTCRSSWPTPRCPGRTRRSRSRPTSTTPGSTCPAGAPSTSPPSSCATRTRSSRSACCSAPTSRC